jgi:hypothetical protein
VLTDDEDLAERRLRGLGAQLRSRRTNAHRLLGALPASGLLVELEYGKADAPNYYNPIQDRTVCPRSAHRDAPAGE